MLPGARGRVSQHLAVVGRVGSATAGVGFRDGTRSLWGCLEAQGGMLELAWVSWDAQGCYVLTPHFDRLESIGISW